MENEETIPLGPPPDPPPAPPVHVMPEESPAPDPLHDERYSFGGAFRAGWLAFQRNYGVLLGAVFALIGIEIAVGIPVGFLDIGVMMLLESILGANVQISPFEWLSNVFVTGPLLVGLFWVGVRATRGDVPEFDKLFDGFRRYPSVLVASGFPAVLNMILTVPAAIAFTLSLGTGGTLNSPAVIASGVFLLVALLAGLYVNVRFFGAGLLVIDDRSPEFSGADALRASWRLTDGRVLSLIGLGIAVYAMLIASAFLLCLPMFFVGMPLAVPIIGAAYSMLGHQRGIAPLGPYESCPHCGYDLSQIANGPCPECGNTPPEVGRASPVPLG